LVEVNVKVCVMVIVTAPQAESLGMEEGIPTEMGAPVMGVTGTREVEEEAAAATVPLGAA
jgi:hypothetical protein